MADYNAISDTQLDPDAPLTSQLGYQFRNNPIAIAEVSNNAPYVQSNWHGFGGSSLVSSVIYDFAVDGAVAFVDTPDFIDGYEYGILLDGVTGANPNVVIKAYGETDAAVTTGITVGVNAGMGPFEVSQPRRALTAHYIYPSGFYNTTYVPSKEATSLGTYSGGAQKILKLRVSVSTGDIGGGKIYLIRKKELF